MGAAPGLGNSTRWGLPNPISVTQRAVRLLLEGSEQRAITVCRTIRYRTVPQFTHSSWPLARGMLYILSAKHGVPRGEAGGRESGGTWRRPGPARGLAAGFEWSLGGEWFRPDRCPRGDGRRSAGRAGEWASWGARFEGGRVLRGVGRGPPSLFLQTSPGHHPCGTGFLASASRLRRPAGLVLLRSESGLPVRRLPGRGRVCTGQAGGTTPALHPGLCLAAPDRSTAATRGWAGCRRRGRLP